MEYTTLGSTGLRISRMGFGGIPIQKVDARATRALMERLCALGVNYIDTARGYTVSEQYLGEALEGLRDRFVVATKSMARTREAMARDIDISLHNLRTDYIDLYQVHNPSLDELKAVCAPGGALEALNIRNSTKHPRKKASVHLASTLCSHGPSRRLPLRPLPLSLHFGRIIGPSPFLCHNRRRRPAQSAAPAHGAPHPCGSGAQCRWRGCP